MKKYLLIILILSFLGVFAGTAHSQASNDLDKAIIVLNPLLKLSEALLGQNPVFSCDKWWENYFYENKYYLVASKLSENEKPSIYRKSSSDYRIPKLAQLGSTIVLSGTCDKAVEAIVNHFDENGNWLEVVQGGDKMTLKEASDHLEKIAELMKFIPKYLSKESYENLEGKFLATQEQAINAREKVDSEFSKNSLRR